MSRQPDAHESYAVAAGTLHWAAVILALSLLAIVLAVYMWARPSLSEGGQPVRPIPPQPRLQADPAADIATVRALQRARLESYQWMDEGHTVARIPIERAMALLAASPAGQPAPAASTERRP
ncbi:hypothetical protein [Fulvimonas yonginensis]|uniref:Uncharacterized protein n=1 Tax=Fulvimonas yonginensis TaxID=1495200 RepID=A0ABU8J7Z7_9GAMM